jgi:PAS domain S-box-containing protein
MPYKILLVEDEALIAMNQAQILEQHGYEVVSVYSGSEAIKTVESNPDISLILMDIDLGSGIDGTETARKILKKQEVPIVFLSSHSEKEYVEKVNKIAGYGYVMKSSGEFVLIESINMAYKLFELQRETRRYARELEDAEQKSEEQRFYLDATINSIPVAIVTSDESNRIVKWNKGAERLFGYTEKEAIGKDIDDLITHSATREREHAVDVTKRVLEAHHIEDRETIRYRKDNEPVHVHLSAAPILKDGTILGVVASYQDITERVKTEKQLEENSELLQNVTDNILDLVALTDLSGNFKFVGKSHAILGYDPEYVLKKNVLDFVHPDDFPRIKKEFNEFVTKREDKRKVEYRYRCADGSYIWLESVGKTVKDNSGEVKELIFSSRDISTRKQIEKKLQKSEERYRHIFNASRVSLWEEDISAIHAHVERLRQEGVTDFEQYFDAHPEIVKELIGEVEIVDVNDTTLRWYRAESKEEMLGSLDQFFDFTEHNIEHFKKELLAICRGERNFEKTIQGKTFDGKTLDLLVRITIPRANDDNNMLVAITDITEIKEMESELSKTLIAKNNLMAELNHRVKNNLSIVSSLINLKDNSLGEEVDLSDIKHQVDAIQTVHDKLSNTEDFSSIELKDYIQDILKTIFSTYSTLKVEISNEIGEVEFPTKKAVSLGLITNEIATNAVKYGFVKEKKAEFTVRLCEDTENGQYIYTLSNSGIPFPEEIDFDNPTTLGLKLIRGLVSQLRGSIDLQKKPIPVFTIRFPMEEK